MSLASAHIQKYSKSPDGHTEYFIKVFYLGKEWGIRKRYSDFVRFEGFFKSSGHCTMEYSLPPKTWWNKNKKSTLFKRQKELQQYLNLLLTTTNATEISLIREFLEVDENMLAFKKKQSSQEINTSAQLQDIIHETKESMIAIPCARPTARTRTTSLNVSMAGKKTSSFSLVSPSSSYGINSAAFPRSTSLRGGKWSEALTQAFHTPREYNNSIDNNRRKVSSASDSNHQLLKEKFQKRCNKLWQNEKEEVLEILYDFEYPNLTTKSAKVFSNPASILHVLSDTVQSSIFANDHVVSVIDGIMEASNAMVFDLTEDAIEHINTNPRLSRPGSNGGKGRMGLSRRPRVDKSPSRAASQASQQSSGISPSSTGSVGRSTHDMSGSYGSNRGVSSFKSSPMNAASSYGSSRQMENSPRLSRSVTMGASSSPYHSSSARYGTSPSVTSGIAVVADASVSNDISHPAAADSLPTFPSLRRGKTEGRSRQEPDFFS